MLGALIYSLCALTCATCAVLLLRSYRATSFRLLFWSGLCFIGLALNNLLVLVDRVMLPNTSLAVLRLVVGAVSLGLLLYGLIWEND